MPNQLFTLKALEVDCVTRTAVATAEDVVARLDERLATSPIAAAFAARTHLVDAVAAPFLDGELVLLEDLVLHDAAADIRAPTHALTRAHAALRARRRIAAALPGWAVNRGNLDVLRGLAPSSDRLSPPPPPLDPIALEEDALARELAALDQLLARTTRVLAGAAVPAPPVPKDLPDPIGGAVKDRLAEWRDILASPSEDPPVLAAARAGAALDALVPLPTQAWLGRILVADCLRATGKTRHHLAALNLGMKLATRARKKGRADRLALWVEAIAAAAQTGLADHDRLLNSYRALQRKLVGRRSTSKLPALVDLVMRAPVVSSQTIATELKVTPRAAQDLVAALGLRELTGRTRYRCWGVL